MPENSEEPIRLGGMALRNGLLIHGPTHWAAAVRDRDGSIRVASEHGSSDPASAPKEHQRCGSNLIAPMMLLSAGGTVLLERLVDEPGPIARGGVSLGGVGAAVEMFVWSDRHSDTALARAFHAPGNEIQRLIATKN